MSVIVLGRFPPPVDGQTLATKRLADLLETHRDVVRADTEPSWTRPKGPAARAAHFLRLRPLLRRILSIDREGTVLWTSISPDPLGHLRDLTITAPAVYRRQRLFAVIHRGNFRKLFESPLTAATARRHIGRVDGYVFLTQHLSDDCAYWIPEAKRHVIPNTIDDGMAFTTDEVNQKQKERSKRTSLRLLFVGHMIASKGYLDALEAVERLTRSSIQVEAHFVGRWNSSADQEAFRQRVQKHGLEGTIVHHGAIESRAAVKSLYKTADVLLLPTYYPNEAQPLVIIEALNAGIPVVSTRHAGIPEMINHGEEGFLVSPKDPDVLGEAVKRLADLETWRRTSSAARRRFIDAYAPDAVRRMWLELIDE